MKKVKENVFNGNIEITEYNKESLKQLLKTVTSIGGDLYVNSNCELKALTSIGGYLSVNSNCELKIKCLQKIDYKIFDNSVFLIESKKTSKGINIYTGGNIVSIKKNKPSIKKCYVAEKGEFSAHGETVKKAIQDLKFKIISDKLKKDPIKKDTLISIKYFRLITGACDSGVRNWMNQNKIEYTIINKGTNQEETIEKKKIKASDLLPILEKTNAYGLDKFKQLIDWA